MDKDFRNIIITIVNIFLKIKKTKNIIYLIKYEVKESIKLIQLGLKKFKI